MRRITSTTTVYGESNTRPLDKPTEVKTHAYQKPAEPKKGDAFSVYAGWVGGGETTTTIKPKKWPKRNDELLDYDKLIEPLKYVIRRGYRLFRKDEVKSFFYDGYNIGLPERTGCAGPKERLSEKGLEIEKKNNKNLIDVVFNIIFQLGLEQGRRHERQFHEPLEIMQNALDHYKENNQSLRYRVDELESTAELKASLPELSDEELLPLIKEDIKRKQRGRMLAFNKEANTFYVEKNKKLPPPLPKKKK